MEKLKKELDTLIKDGYEDLTLSSNDFISLMKKLSSEYPLSINGKYLWIHINDDVEAPFVEKEISDGSAVELTCFEQLD